MAPAYDGAARAYDALVEDAPWQELPLISKAVKAVELVEDGDLVSAANEVGDLVSGVTELLTAVDPLHWLISNGLDFLLSVCEPLNDMIQLVTGDSEALAAASSEFEALSRDMIQLAEETAQLLDEGLASWGGEASAAARKRLGEGLAAIKATGGEADRMRILLDLSGAVMSGAESLVRDILASLVEWLVITWLAALAAAAPTFGGSTVAASAATAAEAGIATSRAVRARCPGRAGSSAGSSACSAR